MIRFIFKALRCILNNFIHFFNQYISFLYLKLNGVKFISFKSSGIPYVMVARGSYFEIGASFFMNNGIRGNPIGSYDRCTFFVDKGAKLFIGNNVGISQSALICHCSITIEDNVKIGGGVKIFDTDFHSLDASIRNSKNDFKHKKKAPVLVKNNAFIGAYSIVLKGVTIGQNSIIGAGSVVTKSVPDNQIWAGNPARFIRAL